MEYNIEEIELVDLGLPSGTLWMKNNLGAETEFDKGLFYQWGAIDGYPEDSDEGRSYSFWSVAPFNGGYEEYNEEYWMEHKNEAVDEYGNLLPENDCVYMATSGLAMLPTQEQFDELISGTISEWIDESGITGMLLTSVVDSGCTIFFPATGYFMWGNYYNEKASRSWSGTLFEDFEKSSHYMLADKDYPIMLQTNRYMCFTVRGVLNP